VIDVSRDQFEELVGEALDSIPEEFTRIMDNVVVLVDDYPPNGRRILGLYEGVPLTKRSHWYAGAMPDAIHIYRVPIPAYVPHAGAGGRAGAHDGDPRGRPPLRHRRRPPGRAGLGLMQPVIREDGGRGCVAGWSHAVR